MNKQLNDTLQQLARAHGVAEKGMGTFMDTLDQLEVIERRFERAIKNSVIRYGKRLGGVLIRCPRCDAHYPATENHSC